MTSHKTYHHKLLSVIIPVYRQQKTIRKNLQSVLSELEVFGMPYECIVVIDGFVDKSFEEASKVSSKKMKVIGYQENHGKGYAVKYGMARAKGDVIAFIDAGGEIRESGIPMLLEHMRWYNGDIIIGSKRHPVSKVEYPFLRKIFSMGYQQFVRLLFGLNITDSQVGLKLYKREVLEDVLPRLINNHFSFDIEMLAVAYHLGYRRIYESPIELDFSQLSSSITTRRVLPVIHHMIVDTMQIFWRLKVLHYYDANNGHKWQPDPELLFSKTIKSA